MNREQYMLMVIRRQIDERIKQHEEDLAGWSESSGYLISTEPDPEERERVRRELKACIAELNLLRPTVVEAEEIAKP
jgi:hypothetical protein